MPDTKLRCALCNRDITNSSREWFATKPHCPGHAQAITQPQRVVPRLYGSQTVNAKGAK